ncbi:MAG: c-type cytochrome [Pikeienuella sp.]
MFADLAKLGLVATLALGAGAALAQGPERAVGARKAVMQLNAHYLGQLGAMAKGDVPYDADAAGAAAASLAKVAALDARAMWPEGSDNGALGADKTEALPVIWTNMDGFAAEAAALASASAALAEAAGGGLDSLRGAMGPVGQACGACHKGFRAPK